MEKGAPSFARATGRTAGRDQTLLEDLRLSRRSCLSAHHHLRASGQKSLLLARHGRAPSAPTPLPKIKLTGSRAAGQVLDPIKAAPEAALQKLRRCGYFSLAA